MNKFLTLATSLLIASIPACTGPTEPPMEPLFEAPEFTLQDCSGENLSRNDLLGHVWVVDFVFTRCGGPCPLMTQSMRSLQSSLREAGLLAPPVAAKLVSISVDPGYDTPEVLHEYASNWGADLDSWHFLTGPAESTLRLIREGFKIAAEREGAESDESGMDLPDIVHSTSFLLVDQRGWIRKIFHLEEPDLKDKIIEGIKVLGRESNAGR